MRLPRHEVEQPCQREADADEFEEDLQAVAQPPALTLPPDDAEDDCDEKREENHQRKMYQAFLPALMSKASRASMRLSRPATIRKTLPYSEVACSGRSLTASPANFDRRYRIPEPMSQRPKRLESRPSPVSRRP